MFPNEGRKWWNIHLEEDLMEIDNDYTVRTVLSPSVVHEKEEIGSLY